MYIESVTPFRCDLNLPTGISEYDDDFLIIVEKINRGLHDRLEFVDENLRSKFKIRVPEHLENNFDQDSKCVKIDKADDDDVAYMNIDRDNKDIRLAIIEYQHLDDSEVSGPAVFSIYNNTVGIARIPFPLTEEDRRDGNLEETVKNLRHQFALHIRKILSFVYYELIQPAFINVSKHKVNVSDVQPLLPKVATEQQISNSKQLFESFGNFQGFEDSNSIQKKEDENSAKPPQEVIRERVAWFTYTLCLEPEELRDVTNQNFLREWLRHTQRPEDADQIIQGHLGPNPESALKQSFTWLNYVYVHHGAEEQLEISNKARMIDALHLAQYFYFTQYILANNLQKALSGAYRRKDTRKPEKYLKLLKARTEYNIIHMHDMRLELNQKKKKQFDDFMRAWDYDELLANSQRIIDMTESRLSELNNRRTARSTFLTDLILVAITFIAIFDLALGFSGFSRELMAQPVLAYTDEAPSRFLTAIASMELDSLLLASAFIVIILFGSYTYAKSR